MKIFRRKGEGISRALLLDIEGTTTSIDFVYKTLFPFARRNARTFLEEYYGSESLQRDMEELRQEHVAEAREPDCPVWHGESPAAEIASALAYIHWLMDRDRKSTALKSIQGNIWGAGYRKGELRSHVYPDVLPAFQRWRQAGKTIGIFSSGSVLAQKLLFAHTTAGDLTIFIKAFFDTTTGPKTVRESYQKIASALALPSEEILFVSDNEAELDAARAAGMRTLLCVRLEQTDSKLHRHTVIRSLDEIAG